MWKQKVVANRIEVHPKMLITGQTVSDYGTLKKEKQNKIGDKEQLKIKLE